MPLPIIIAGYALGGAAFTGAGATIDGVRRIRGAKRTVAEQQERLEATTAITDALSKTCSDALADLGRTKYRTLQDGLLPFQEAFSQLKNVDFDGTSADDRDIPVDVVAVTAAGRMHLSLFEGLSTAAAAGGLGVTASVAAGWGVSSLAAASTGTAISGLSGAAASNATLAWLGGGSLASGGGGVAAGTAVAGGILVVPAVLVGGLVVFHKGRKATAKAETFKSNVDTAIAKHHEQQIILKAVTAQAERTEELLRALTGGLVRRTARVEVIVERETDWTKLDAKERSQVRDATVYALAAGGLVQTPILDEDGSLVAAMRDACDYAGTVLGDQPK